MWKHQRIFLLPCIGLLILIVILDKDEIYISYELVCVFCATVCLSKAT